MGSIEVLSMKGRNGRGGWEKVEPVPIRRKTE